LIDIIPVSEPEKYAEAVSREASRLNISHKGMSSNEGNVSL